MAGNGAPSDGVCGEGVRESRDGAAARGAGRRRARGPRGGPHTAAAQVVPSGPLGRTSAGAPGAPPSALNGQNISNSGLVPGGLRDSVVRLSPVNPGLRLGKGAERNDTSDRGCQRG